MNFKSWNWKVLFARLVDRNAEMNKSILKLWLMCFNKVLGPATILTNFISFTCFVLVFSSIIVSLLLFFYMHCTILLQKTFVFMNFVSWFCIGICVEVFSEIFGWIFEDFIRRIYFLLYWLLVLWDFIWENIFWYVMYGTLISHLLFSSFSTLGLLVIQDSLYC